MLSASRTTAIRALALSAGAFVLGLLLTAPLRGEPAAVIASYLGLLIVFALCLAIKRTHPRLAGAIVCLGPFVLVTGLVAIRGGATSTPGMLAYLTLVVIAALCWGSRGAFFVAALGSATVAVFCFLGPIPRGMGALQSWAEVSFQLAVVAFVSDVLLRAVDQATMQTIRLEAEEHRARLARLELEARVLESRSLEVVGRLAGGVAHDFNNLLTVILSGSEYLSRRPKLEPNARESVLGIEDAARRAAKLTQQLLAVGRKQVLSPVVLCPRMTIEELAPLTRRLLPATVELILDLDPATQNVKVDESRLEQILLNLITNASDAMPSGGTITVVTRNTSIARRSASNELPAGDYVEISVTDTGAGMTDDIVSRIFEPFFTTKTFGAGTGLGLATVLGIVQQSGGAVHVESAPGKGTTFRVFLPRTAEARTETRKIEVTRPATNHARILLVEDEDAVRSVTRRMLESLGHSVREEAHPEDALRLFAEAPLAFDVLVSDVIMPNMTGPTFAAKLQSSHPDLKVLFISGYPADQLPVAEALPGQSQYLAKPFTRKELAAKLAEMLRSDP